MLQMGRKIGWRIDKREKLLKIEIMRIYTATKIPLMYSFSGNCLASFTVSTFICLWAIYIFPGSVHLFSCSRIGRPILEIYKNLSQIYEYRNWETEHYDYVLEITVSFLGIHKRETDIYIGFSLAFICSVQDEYWRIAWAKDRSIERINKENLKRIRRECKGWRVSVESAESIW